MDIGREEGGVVYSAAALRPGPGVADAPAAWGGLWGAAGAFRRRAAILSVMLLAAAGTAWLFLAYPLPAHVPGHTLWRVVPQRPAADGSFAPDGRRFVFVHGDGLWLADSRGHSAAPRRIGGPAVAGVYGARWAAEDAIVVHEVLPRQGGAVGVLDLGSGKLKLVGRHVREGEFSVSLQGGVVVWRSRPRPDSDGDVWVGRVEGGAPRRVASGAGAFALVPAPAGEHLAGISVERKPFLQSISTGQASPLAVEAGEQALAATWSPDGTSVAYLMGSGAAGGAGAGEWACVYRVGQEKPASRVHLPEPCSLVRWDADGKGLLCRAGADEGSLWHVPLDGFQGPRRLFDGPVRDFAPMARGYVLAVVPDDKNGCGHLYLLHVRGRLAQRMTNLPSFDLISDVSSDFRRVLLTRASHDDRGDLDREATLWVFEIARK